MQRIINALAPVVALASIASCAPAGANYEANVYKVSQVNQVQEAKVISILVIMPAKVEVPNEQAKKGAQIVGGLLGAIGGGVLGNTLGNHDSGTTAAGAAGGAAAGVAAGSLVPDKVLVDGVTLTYVENNKTLSSTQVGRLCEFKLGSSVVISTGPGETRVQPNSTCPITEAAKK